MKEMKDIKRILELYQLYGSIRAVERSTGYCRKTVTKYLKRIDQLKKGTIESVLEHKISQAAHSHRTVSNDAEQEILFILKQNLTKHPKLRTKNTTLLNRLQKKGYVISLSTIDRIVRQWKQTHQPKEIFIQQDPALGIVCEFDWGYVPLVIDAVSKSVPAVFFTLRHSSFRFAKLYPRETTPFVIQAHLDFFSRIHGIPSDIAYDNLKTVVNQGKTKSLNESFAQFALFCGFTVSPCHLGSPEEKGTVERTVGYLRNKIFCEQDHFRSLEEANQFLQEKQDLINRQPVYRRELTPDEALEQQVDQLHPFPSSQYENYLWESRQINPYHQISIDSNFYSIPETYSSSRIWVKIYPDRLECLNGEKTSVIAVHRRLFGKHQSSLHIAHYVKTLRQKPGSLPGSVVYEQSHPIWKQLRTSYYQQDSRSFIDLLLLLKQYDEKRLLSVIDSLLKLGVKPTRDYLIQLLEQKEDPAPISFSYPSIAITVKQPDPSVYDQLLGGNHG